MRTLRIAFSDFWPGFNPADCRIWGALGRHYHLVLSSDFNEADLLIFGDFGTDHWQFKGRKAYLTGENMLPDFEQCDLAFTPAEIPGDRRAVRFPYYAQNIQDPSGLLRPPGYDASPHLDRKGFCSFVVSNPMCRMRNRVFKKIRRSREVASGGRHFNNMGGPVADKMAFLLNYRFNIACENSRSPGYITEKLVEPLMAGAIPIYWGAPDVYRDFNPGCMLNVSDFRSLGDLVSELRRLDDDKDARLRMLQAPVFQGNRLPECMSDAHLSLPLIDLIENRAPASRRYRSRRLREHLLKNESYMTYKFRKVVCRMEIFMWNSGLRF